MDFKTLKYYNEIKISKKSIFLNFSIIKILAKECIRVGVPLEELTAILSIYGLSATDQFTNTSKKLRICKKHHF